MDLQMASPPSSPGDEDALLHSLVHIQQSPLNGSEDFDEDYWRSWDFVTEGRARRLSLDNVDAIIVDRLSQNDPFDFLEGIYVSSSDECPELAQIVLKYAKLVIIRPELIPMADGRQLGSQTFCDWLCLDRRIQNRSVKALVLPDVDDAPTRPVHDIFLSALMDSMTSDEIHDAVNIVVNTLVISIRKENLLSPAYQNQLRGLRRFLLCNRSCLEGFSVLPHFITFWINGPNFEFDSVMGVFLRLSALTERDFSVADTVFAQADSMSEQHILVNSTNLRHKLDRIHAILITIWHTMLSEQGVCHSALLAWIACVLHGNWSRARLRSRNRAGSSNEFLMSICVLMTNIAFNFLKIDADHIKPDFFMWRSRLDLGDNETRIYAPLSEVQELVENRRIVIQSEADQSFLRTVLTDSHFGIICDSCRSRCIQGVRFKCTHCQDFDLCEKCESDFFLRALGRPTQPPLTYQCPFRLCRSDPAMSSLVESEFRSHVAVVHRDNHNPIRCPICAVSGGDGLHSNLFEHVRRDHPDIHDHRCHVMLKIRRMITCSPWKRTLHMELPEFISPELTDQDLVIHDGIRCSSCQACPIQGIRFVCINCPATFDWCSDCESQKPVRHSHPADHLFIQLRRAVRTGSWMEALPAVPLYPNAISGSYDVELHDEWFFLTLHALHLGVIQTCARYSSLLQSIQGNAGCNNFFLKLLAAFVIFSPPSQLSAISGFFFHILMLSYTAFGAALLIPLTGTNRANPQLPSMLKMKLTLGVQLLDPVVLRTTLSFYGLTARFLLRLMGGPAFPLPEPCPTVFATIPEYLLEDMAMFCLFLCENDCAALEDALPSACNTDLTLNHHCAFIVRLFVSLMASPGYVRNPHLRSKLVEVFCGLAPFATSHGAGTQRFTTLISTDEFLINNLIPALFRHYIDAEHSGSASQFYDKFNMRNLLELVINWVILSDVHKDTLQHYCVWMLTHQLLFHKNNPEETLQFIHCLVTDMVFVMDEVLMKLEQFHDSNHNIESRSFASIRRHLRIVTTLSNEALRTLLNLASFECVQTIVMRPEMAERIAQTVSYYVFKLVEILPIARKEYLEALGFIPSNWLKALCQIYVNLSSYQQFNLAVVSDERSFRPDLFSNCLQALRQSESLVDNSDPWYPDLLIDLEKFFNELVVLSEQQKNIRQELGDVPEEFLDPILNTLMEDPVILPSSGVTLDRAVICRHLLSSQSDPFCREPLTPEMLRPNVELRMMIDEWKQKRQPQ